MFQQYNHVNDISIIIVIAPGYLAPLIIRICNIHNVLHFTTREILVIDIIRIQTSQFHSPICWHHKHNVFSVHKQWHLRDINSVVLSTARVNSIANHNKDTIMFSYS